MNFFHSEDPIVACSTSTQSNAAIGIIRISGFKSLDFFSNFFELNLSGPIEPKKVYVTNLVLRGQLVDEVCFTYFQAPHSYNGENIIELGVHGNLLNVDKIISIFINHGGCRLAGPGEFTFRALRNKKLTLSQVEGLDLLLNANSNFALAQGLELLNGELNQIYQDLYDLFVRHKSSLELLIDFSEDVGEEIGKNYFYTSFENFYKKFKVLEKRASSPSHHLLSPEVLVVGPPNSGKSTLFNFLLSQERAIVSPIAGTTRDYISEFITIAGVRFKLIDTAGIRNAMDPIEEIGINLAKEKISKSFYSILLINPFETFPGLDEFFQKQFDLILFTHADLPNFTEAKISFLKNYPILGSIGAYNLLNPNENLEKLIYDSLLKKYDNLTQGKPILLSRHKILIDNISNLLPKYKELLETERDIAILSHELNSLGHCVSELLGIISPEQILNSIFNNFCIGK